MRAPPSPSATHATLQYAEHALQPNAESVQLLQRAAFQQVTSSTSIDSPTPEPEDENSASRRANPRMSIFSKLSMKLGVGREPDTIAESDTAYQSADRSPPPPRDGPRTVVMPVPPPPKLNDLSPASPAAAEPAPATVVSPAATEAQRQEPTGNRRRSTSSASLRQLHSGKKQGSVGGKHVKTPDAHLPGIEAQASDVHIPDDDGAGEDLHAAVKPAAGPSFGHLPSITARAPDMRRPSEQLGKAPRRASLDQADPPVTKAQRVKRLIDGYNFLAPHCARLQREGPHSKPPAQARACNTAFAMPRPDDMDSSRGAESEDGSATDDPTQTVPEDAEVQFDKQGSQSTSGFARTSSKPEASAPEPAKPQLTRRDSKANSELFRQDLATFRALEEARQQLRNEQASHARSKRQLEQKEREIAVLKGHEAQLIKELTAIKTTVPQELAMPAHKSLKFDLPPPNHRFPHEVCCRQPRRV